MEVKVYKSKVSMLFVVVLIIVLGMCGLVFYKIFTQDSFGWNADTMVPLVIISLSAILLVSLFVNTKYTITNTHVLYVSGPFKGEIPIESIQKVKKNTTKYTGIKPALGKNGLVIYYNKYDEIYISPDSSESFVERLLKINPTIQVLN